MNMKKIISSISSEAEIKCKNTPEYKKSVEEMYVKLKEACKGNDLGGLFQVQDSGSAWIKDYNFYTCPDFVHSSYVIGDECPEGYTAVKTLEVADQTVTECLGVIREAFTGEYVSGYCPSF